MNTLTSSHRVAIWVVVLTLVTMALVAFPLDPASADHDPVFTVSDVEMDEGDSFFTIFAFTVTASSNDLADGETLSVDYATQSFTASAGSDFVAASGTLEFPPGVTSRTVNVQVNGDTMLEDNEIFFLGLENQSQGTLVGPGTGTILNDDGPTISIDDVTEAEGDAGTTDFVFTLQLSAAHTEDVTVTYTTSDGSATVADDDYEATSGTVTFQKGETERTVTVKVNGDTKEEGNETFTVNLSSATGNASIADGSGQGTIVNDDAAVNLFVDDVQVVEGDSPAGPNLAFTVRAVGESDTASFQFSYQTQAGTATANQDYIPRVGFDEVDLNDSVTINVPVIGDTTPEAHETVNLIISNAQGANIADNTGEGRILNDDANISVGDATVGENDGQAGFVLNLDFPIHRDATVTWNARNVVDADGVSGARASEGSDYDEPDGEGPTATIPAGRTTTEIHVDIVDDALHENTENFIVEITDADDLGNAGSGVGSITDNDPQPAVSIPDQSVVEGTGGNATRLVSVELSEPAGRGVTVEYATRDGVGPDGAVAGSDYIAKTGSVTIPTGATSATFGIDIVGDTSPEPDEHFFVDISNPSGATVGDGTGRITIPNDDENVGVLDMVVAETDGTTTANVTVRRGEVSDTPVTFDWTTAESSQTNKATADVDYDTASGSGEIPAGEQETTIPITINGDDVDEADEYFDVVISNVVGGIVIAGDERGEVKIDDDDGTSLSVLDAAADERTGTITFVVQLEGDGGAASADVTFDWETSDGTATATSDPIGSLPPSTGDDYDDASGSGTIPAGETSTTVVVDLVDDTTPEDHETFLLTLSNVASGDVSVTEDDLEATGTIRNDDAALTIADAEVAEGNSGTRSMSFVVTTPYASTRDHSASWSTADDTATAGSDYVGVAGGNVTILAGETSATLMVTVNGDTIDEDDETFDVTLSAPSAGTTLADSAAVGTIRDDDGAPSLSVSDVSKIEGDAGTTDYVFTISLSRTSAKDVAVDVATADDTAEAGSDYQALETTTVEIAAGTTVATVTVLVAGDTAPEDDEQFLVELSNPVNATIGDGTGIGTIRDDDTPGSADNDPPTVDAGANRAVETATSQTYQASVSDPDGDPVTVTWNFGDGTSPAVGNPVAHTYATVGVFTVTVTATDGRGGSATDKLTVNAFDTGVIGRAWGDDRILTAVAASQAHWPAGHAQASAHTGPAATDALIALSDKYPDALAAGPLSAKLDAPLLLSGPSSLPSVVEDELERLGVDTVWLLGGPNSLSPAIEQRLKDLGYEVNRRSGANRFETAAAVAKEVGRNSAGEVVVTLGDHADQNRAFPDALSAGSLSASPQRMPVVLTLTDSIPAVTEEALADLDTKKVWIVGGLASVSANVEARLRSLGYAVERLAGPGRYETSVDVAEEALSRAPDGPVRLVFATGAKFPDGLAGGAVAGRVDGILLLVPNGDLPAATRQFLADNADRFDVGVILGGTNTLSESVRLALVDLMDN